MATDSWALAVDEQEAAVKSVSGLAGLGDLGGCSLKLGDLRVGSARAPLEFAAGNRLVLICSKSAENPLRVSYPNGLKFFPW